MKQIKKSFNMSEDLADRIDSFVAANSGTNFTFVVVQALEAWLKNPQVNLSPLKSDASEVPSASRPKFGGRRPHTQMKDI